MCVPSDARTCICAVSCRRCLDIWELVLSCGGRLIVLVFSMTSDKDAANFSIIVSSTKLHDFEKIAS